MVLAIWLGTSGIAIVRGVTPRESLERASQASMVYIGLFALGLIFGVISLVLALGSPFGEILVSIIIGSIVLNLVYAIPPAFVIFVRARFK